MSLTVGKLALSGVALLVATAEGVPLVGLWPTPQPPMTMTAAVALIPEPTLTAPQVVQDSVPPMYRQQFERFLAETDPTTIAKPRNRPVQLAALNGTDTIPVTASMRPPAPTPAAVAVPLTSNGCDLAPISLDPTPPRKQFEIGDKVKLTFYEQVEDAGKDKWSRGTGTASKNFQQFVELSGEYSVLEDGSISLPLLGSFPADNQTPQDLQNVLSEAFSKLTSRKGFVTIIALERPPIYVLGPVKTPGSYKFAPGMTVFHALAMAGGYDKPEAFQKVEVLREQSKRFGGLETISELLVRAAVLKAERDRVAPVSPQQLSELVGDARARQMIASEVDKRQAIVVARRSQEAALTQQIEFARTEAANSQTRMRAVDENLQIRVRRLNAVKELAARGTVSQVVATTAHGDALDAENRRSDVVTQIAQAQQRLAQLEQDQARLVASTRGDLESAILTIEQQVASTARETETSAGVLGALKVKFEQDKTASAGGFTYEVVRQTPKGPVSFISKGMTTLNPGDLVKVVSPEEAAMVPAEPGITITPNGPTNTGNVRKASACK